MLRPRGGGRAYRRAAVLLVGGCTLGGWAGALCPTTISDGIGAALAIAATTGFAKTTTV